MLLRGRSCLVCDPTRRRLRSEGEACRDCAAAGLTFNSGACRDNTDCVDECEHAPVVVGRLPRDAASRDFSEVVSERWKTMYRRHRRAAPTTTIDYYAVERRDSENQHHFPFS